MYKLQRSGKKSVGKKYQPTAVRSTNVNKNICVGSTIIVASVFYHLYPLYG